MSSFSLDVTKIGKTFNRRKVLSDISFSMSTGEALAITGKNGAGKSTLIKIVSGLLTPSSGSLRYVSSGDPVEWEHLRPFVGLVSPYLQMYDEFSAWENLQTVMRIRGNAVPRAAEAEPIFRKFGLWERRDDLVRTYSSGMKQRLKYIVALAHQPSIVMLDEPTANLDEDGARVVRETVQELQAGTLMMIATNDEREASWCGRRIHVGA